jgi:hypothetical protein
MILDPRIDLSPGEYQAVLSGFSRLSPQSGLPLSSDTVVHFTLTEPGVQNHKSAAFKGADQAGLGGRVARAWLSLDDPNPATAMEAHRRLQELLRACDEQNPPEDLEHAIGSVLWIRLARTILRFDPSASRVAAVSFQSLTATPPEFVKV